MSNFTTEVRFICESEAGATESKGFNCVDEILRKSVEKVFNFNFPIFDEKYRIPLETKILRYYYTREICDETVGLWKLRLYNRLNLIMPYYNQLYESALLKFNPLYDVDLTTTHTRTNDHTQNDTKSGETHNTHEDKTITDFDKTGSENGEFQTNTTNSGEHQTNTTTNVIHQTNITESNPKTITDNLTSQGTKNTSSNGTDQLTLATKITNADGITNHSDTHSLINHHDTEVTDGQAENNNDQSQDITDTDSQGAWDYYSDTPQGSVANLASLSYLTNARNNTLEDTKHKIGSVVDHGNGTTHSDRNLNHTGDDSTVTDTTETVAKEQNNTGTETTTKNNTEGETNSKTDNRTTTETNNKTGNENGTKSETGNENGTSSETKNENGTSEKSYTENSDTTINNTGKFDITTGETGNSVFTGTEEYIQHVVGKTAGINYSKMLLDFRDTFINVDKMIIDNLSDLFFGLYE